MYRLLLGLIVGFLCVSPVFAADAGEVSVPLEGEQPRGAEARELALRQGLETVIRRLTGRDRVADLPGVAGVLEDPANAPSDDMFRLTTNPEDAPEAHKVAQTLRNEWVAQIVGRVTPRTEETRNPNLADRKSVV